MIETLIFFVVSFDNNTKNNNSFSGDINIDYQC